MARYVALLRGINVGGRTKVAMADLRDLLTGLGHTDVRTHLQSGNAVFTSTATRPSTVESAIERRIKKALGLTLDVMVRSRDELAGVIERNTLPTTNGSRLVVTFLSGPPDRGRLAELDPAEFAPEQFQIGEREIYLWCPNGIHDSPVVKALSEKRVGQVGTARNWNTVTRLLTLADA